MDSDLLLEKARSAAQAGQKQEAARLYSQVIVQNASSIEAWMGLAEVVDDPQRKRDCYAYAAHLTAIEVAAGSAPGKGQAVDTKAVSPAPSGQGSVASSAAETRPAARPTPAAPVQQADPHPTPVTGGQLANLPPQGPSPERVVPSESLLPSERTIPPVRAVPDQSAAHAAPTQLRASAPAAQAIPQPPRQTVRYCMACGAANPLDFRYCCSCGVSLEDPTRQPSAVYQGVSQAATMLTDTATRIENSGPVVKVALASGFALFLVVVFAFMFVRGNDDLYAAFEVVRRFAVIASVLSVLVARGISANRDQALLGAAIGSAGVGVVAAGIAQAVVPVDLFSRMDLIVVMVAGSIVGVLLFHPDRTRIGESVSLSPFLGLVYSAVFIWASGLVANFLVYTALIIGNGYLNNGSWVNLLAKAPYFFTPLAAERVITAKKNKVLGALLAALLIISLWAVEFQYFSVIYGLNGNILLNNFIGYAIVAASLGLGALLFCQGVDAGGRPVPKMNWGGFWKAFFAVAGVNFAITFVLGLLVGVASVVIAATSRDTQSIQILFMLTNFCGAFFSPMVLRSVRVNKREAYLAAGFATLVSFLLGLLIRVINLPGVTIFNEINMFQWGLSILIALGGVAAFSRRPEGAVGLSRETFEAQAVRPGVSSIPAVPSAQPAAFQANAVPPRSEPVPTYPTASAQPSRSPEEERYVRPKEKSFGGGCMRIGVAIMATLLGLYLALLLLSHLN